MSRYGRYKLGALPAVRPHGLSDLAVYAGGKLPTPPAKVVNPCRDLRMFDNDRLGCCTYSGVGHSIIAWNALTDESDTVPTDDQLQVAYFAQTGGADSGCVEADVLQKWQRTGLFGHQLAGYAPVDSKSVEAIHQAIAFYGVAYFGVALPESAQDQFPDRVWTVEPGSPIEGGHCIVGVAYDSSYVYCRTWGGTVAVSYPWLDKYLTESWALLPNQYVEAGKGPTLDLASLRADLAAL